MHHPAQHGACSIATYPLAFESVWLPPTPCKAVWFFDHSSGHGAYAKEALLSNHANKGPDWKGSVSAMRDGWFYDAGGARKVQAMQFQEGDTLPCGITAPAGIDLDADPAAAVAAAPPAPAPAAPDVPPATEAELASAFKLFYTGKQQTLKRKHPNLTSDALKQAAKVLWDALSTAARLVFVCRVRAKANAGSAQPRFITVESPVPRVLWGRNKGTECILSERGLYPAAGLKGACQCEKNHTATNDCCCSRLLSVQPDFAEECSALQHLVEERISLGLETTGRRLETTARHFCLFLPKFHCELNWIERLWGASKAYTRRHCLYTLPGLRETVPTSLTQDLSKLPLHLANQSDLPVAPLFLQRRWARISRQFMAAYRREANGADAIKSVKSQRTSKRHRDPNDKRSKQVEAQMACTSAHC